MMGLGSDSQQANLPLWQFALIWYLFAILAFVAQQWLIWAVNSADKKLSGQTRWPVALSGLNVCALVGIYEFWLRPAFKVYYEFAFRDPSRLPQLTHFCFYRVPSGALMAVAIILWGVNSWLSARRNEPSGRKDLLPFVRLLFLAFGLVFLVLIPLALFCPLF